MTLSCRPDYPPQGAAYWVMRCNHAHISNQGATLRLFQQPCAEKRSRNRQGSPAHNTSTGARPAPAIAGGRSVVSRANAGGRRVGRQDALSHAPKRPQQEMDPGHPWGEPNNRTQMRRMAGRHQPGSTAHSSQPGAPSEAAATAAHGAMKLCPTRIRQNFTPINYNSSSSSSPSGTSEGPQSLDAHRQSSLSQLCPPIRSRGGSLKAVLNSRPQCCSTKTSQVLVTFLRASFWVSSRVKW
mmetsp:Transcript_98741/g.226894  ORF Transcript_98741/g.226894 Transcript_98741/m.226894 type:complete len:240 (-) Transcript_98741:290-1009(-)